MRFVPIAAGLAALLASLTASSQPTPQGYLCCNLRTDGKWISDINYMEAGKRVIPLGTTAKVTGYGRYRALVELGDNTTQAIGNDYSRDLEMGAFAARYVVAEDPSRKLAAMPAKIREAVSSARLTAGMTRDQVIMSVGYPVTSENPRLDNKVWRFWLSSFQEFQVVFDDKGLVKDIATFDPATRSAIVME